MKVALTKDIIDQPAIANVTVYDLAPFAKPERSIIQE
jgi:hypothetical protein